MLDEEVEHTLTQISNLITLLQSDHVKEEKITKETTLHTCDIDVESEPVSITYKYDDVVVQCRLGAINFTSNFKKQTNIPSQCQNSVSSVKTNLLLDEVTCRLVAFDKSFNLIGPVRVNIEVSFQFGSSYYNPIRGFFRCSLGRLVLHVGPKHILILEKLTPRFSIENKEDGPAPAGIDEEDAREIEPLTDDGEHFYDDLRLGTFTVSKKSQSHLPSPYCVEYSSTSISWTYPRARTLTKLTVLPLPLTSPSSSSLHHTQGKLVHLSCPYFISLLLKICS